MCHACGTSLGNAEIVHNTYRIENVATYPAEHITANDEERQRQGFDLQTTFEWAVRDQEIDVRLAAACDAAGEIVHMAYGTGGDDHPPQQGAPPESEQEDSRLPHRSGVGVLGQERGRRRGRAGARSHRLAPAVDRPSVQDRKNALSSGPPAALFRRSR